MPQRGMVFTGARARFSLDGVPIAYALRVNYSEEITYEEVEPLDQFDVAEHVPTAYRVTLSAQLVRIIKNGIKLHEGLGIMPTLERILDNKEMTGTIEDPKTGTILANIQRVKCASYQLGVGKGIVMMDTTFKAIRIRDESEVV